MLIFINGEKMNTINQQETGCYLLKIQAARLKSLKSLEKVIFNGPALKVESIYTESGEIRKKYTDIYKQQQVTLSVDNNYIKGYFVKMKKNTCVYFYMNEDGNTAVLTILHFCANKTEDISALEILDIDTPEFSLVINTVLPDVDMVSAKLMAS